MSHFKSITNPSGVSHCAIRTSPARRAPAPDPEDPAEAIADRLESRMIWWLAALAGWQAVIAAVLGVMLRVALEGGV